MLDFFSRAGTSRASPDAQAAQPRHVLKGSLQVTVKILSGRRANFKIKASFLTSCNFLSLQKPQALKCSFKLHISSKRSACPSERHCSNSALGHSALAFRQQNCIWQHCQRRGSSFKHNGKSKSFTEREQSTEVTSINHCFLHYLGI